jgi:hypothetical protein
LQSIDSETVVSFYKVLKLIPKDVILAEMTKIRIKAQDMAKDRGGIDKNSRKNISSNINLKYGSCRYVHAE